MFKVNIPTGLAVVTSAIFFALVASASAGFVFKPVGPITYTTVGEKTNVEVENTGAINEAPRLGESQKNNLNAKKEQYIGVNKTKTLKECEIIITPGKACLFEVEYMINRGTEPSPEFAVTVEPPNGCPNMIKFKA